MQDMLAKRVREWTQQWQEEGAQQGLAAERTWRHLGAPAAAGPLAGHQAAAPRREGPPSP